MKVIGITGGVGCGKSAILKHLKEKYNCVIFLADDAAKELEKPGESCYKKLITLLGDRILEDNGEINSKKMSAAIFDDEELLKKVNDIIHPAVRVYILETIEKAKNEGFDYFFLEAALLIECGYKEVVDEMWYIFATEDERRRRLKESRGYTDSKIDAIMASQLTEEEFRANSDFVIDNNGSIRNSLKQVDLRLA